MGMHGAVSKGMISHCRVFASNVGGKIQHWLPLTFYFEIEPLARNHYYWSSISENDSMMNITINI